MFEDLYEKYPPFIPNKKYYKDLSGQKFGLLTVLYRCQNPNPRDAHAMWVCKCECGNIKIFNSAKLVSGRAKSCGCYKYNFIDEIGNKYGKLTVIECAGIGKDRHILWKCKCECGNEIITNGNVLRGDRTLSCGCQHSKGEFFITQILNELQIPYIKEYHPEDLISPFCGIMRFDFKIIKPFFYIEYDGSQHYRPWGSGREEAIKHLERLQIRDSVKNEYCIKNNIPLLRIKYTTNTKEYIKKKILSFIKDNFEDKNEQSNN